MQRKSPDHDFWEEARIYAIAGNYKSFIKAYDSWKESDSFKRSLRDEITFAKNALLQWAGAKNKQIVWYLLNDGANPQIALDYASNDDDTEFAQSLLSKGASASKALDFLSGRRQVGFFSKRGKNEDFLKSVVVTHRNSK